MMGLRTSTLLGVALAALAVWVVMATNPAERIERSCQPVLWAGNVMTSLTALTVPQYQDHVDEGFQSADYACRYTVWRLFYEEAWLERTGRESVNEPEVER